MTSGVPSLHHPLGAILVRVPSDVELQQAAEMLRQIVEQTTDLPDDTLADARLRDRLALAAAVLDAAASHRDEAP